MSAFQEHKAEKIIYLGLWMTIFSLVLVILFSQWVSGNKPYFDIHALLMMDG